MSITTGIIKTLIGQVFAISPDGSSRLLIEGDKIFAGEQIETGANGAVTIGLPDGTTLDLGRGSHWGNGAPLTEAAEPSVAAMQQAIADGLDPTQNLEATAAGPQAVDNASEDAGPGGAHTHVILDLTGEVVDPAAGYPTEGFDFTSPATDEEMTWLNPDASDVSDTANTPPDYSIPQEPEPEPEPEPAPVVTFEQADAPLITPVATVRITEDELYTPEPVRMNTVPSEPAPAVVQKKRRSPLWLLPVAAVIIAAIATPLLWPKQAPTAAPVTSSAPAPVAIAPAPVKTVEPLELKLPLHQAEVVEPKVKTPAPAAEPVVITAIPKDAMVMEANQVKAGLTRFLNGTWRAFLDVQDPLTGKPPSLRYQIQNNKGFARVVHGDNIVCRVDVFSGLHSNGELLIKTRGNARCTDGSRYPMPEVTCKAGASDVAECTARYDANTVVPLTFKKAGV